MKVALLHPCFWPEVRRGAERINDELARGLVARGHRVRLITSHPGRTARAVEHGVEVSRLRRPALEAHLRARKFDDHLTHVPRSVVELVSFAPDAVVSSWPADAAIAARWGAWRGVPVVHYHMGVPLREHLVHRRLRLETLLAAVRRCDATVALSQTAADAFDRVLGAHARVIYPAVHVQDFGMDTPRAPEPTVFCAASIATPMKRVGLLVEAWPAVRRERPDARLVLLRPPDQALAAELAASPGIELVDERPPDQLAPLYGSAWVSALPSLGESFGLVLVEALACGTPVVGTRHAAIPEVVDRPEIGRLFAADDHPDGLVRALLEAFELAGDAGTAAACRARAEEFSRERLAERFEGLIQKLG